MIQSTMHLAAQLLEPQLQGAGERQELEPRARLSRRMLKLPPELAQGAIAQEDAEIYWGRPKTRRAWLPPQDYAKWAEKRGAPGKRGDMFRMRTRHKYPPTLSACARGFSVGVVLPSSPRRHIRRRHSRLLALSVVPRLFPWALLKRAIPSRAK